MCLASLKSNVTNACIIQTKILIAQRNRPVCGFMQTRPLLDRVPLPVPHVELLLIVFVII